MSDTPIAEQLAAELGTPWVIYGHMEGQLDDTGSSRYFEPSALGSETGVLADPQPDAAPCGPVGAASTSTPEGHQ